jgi:VanZ family protein
VPRVASLWLPVLAWAAVIFAFSSIHALSTGLGIWDTLLRKGAHVFEFAVLGALLARATGRFVPALVLGVLYAVSDEVHQHFVPGREGRALDVAIDAAGAAIGAALFRRARTP